MPDIRLIPGRPEHAPSETESVQSKPWQILVVDDDPDVHALTRLMSWDYRFQDRPLEILSAYSAEGARGLLQINPDIAVAVIDVVMETRDAGLELVQDIREKLGNFLCRIILRTGETGAAPEHDVVALFDICDYLTKAQLTEERFHASLFCALRAYDQLAMVEAVRRDVESQANERMRELGRKKDKSVNAARAKSEFLALISHELRTPLNSILGFTKLAHDMLQDRTDDAATITSHLNHALEASNYLLGLVNRVLDLAKIEAGRMELAPQRLDVAGTLRRALWMVGEQAKTSGISLGLSITSNVAPLWADEQMLTEMLLNLLSNAIKFTPRHGTIELWVESGSDGGVTIAIADTGCGIPANKIGAVFTPYEQIDNHFQRAPHGTGLGLSLVRGMMDMHRGCVTIASTEGVGTTVTLLFPPAPPAGSSSDMSA